MSSKNGIYQSFEGRDAEWIRDFIGWYSKYRDEAQKEADYYAESVRRARQALDTVVYLESEEQTS